MTKKNYFESLNTVLHTAYLGYRQPIFICSHNRKLELNASYYSTEQIAMPTSKNTVVFIHQRADQEIIKAICLDLLVLSMLQDNAVLKLNTHIMPVCAVLANGPRRNQMWLLLQCRLFWKHLLKTSYYITSFVHNYDVMVTLKSSVTMSWQNCGHRVIFTYCSLAKR